MDSKKIIVDGEEAEFFLDISPDMKEKNNQVLPDEFTDDTLDLSELPELVKENDSDE